MSTQRHGDTGISRKLGDSVSLCFKKGFFVLAAFALQLVGLQPMLADDWMSRVSDDTYVSQLSIPGAHDAGTGHGFVGFIGSFGESFARTQDKTIAEQWESGIRAFDLRPCVDGTELRINHGVIQTALTLDEAFIMLCDLLDQHPSEAAIVIIRHETDGDDNSSSWSGMMTSLLGSEPTKSHVVNFKPLMTMGEMRGKLLVLSRDLYATVPVGGFISGWSHSADFSSQKNGKIKGRSTQQGPCYIQDFYDCTATGAKETKRQSILTMLQYSAEQNTNNRLWVINHTSGYSLTTSFFGSTVATSDGYRDNAATQNGAVIDWLAEHSGPTGLVMMDFAGVDVSNGFDVKGLSLTQALIENNFHVPTGISHVNENDNGNAKESCVGFLYDLVGRRVEATTNAGLYVKDGRKILVR